MTWQLCFLKHRVSSRVDHSEGSLAGSLAGSIILKGH